MSIPTTSKWQREYAAFRRLLPELRADYQGKFVAIHGEQVVDSGDDKIALALCVLGEVGNIDIHIGLVTDEPTPIARSGFALEIG